MSTVKEMREERNKTEMLIAELLKAFEVKHSVSIDRIELERVTPIGQRESCLRTVNIQVSL